MPAPKTIDDFLALARKSGLVDAALLDGTLEHLRSAAPLPEDPKKLAVQLVRKGVMTIFHAEQFLRGIWRGFTIGKYKILERLGSGGMGIVYLGEHKFMGHRVAIKVLPVALAEQRWFLDHFYQEARAAASLNHPNIVRAHDIDHENNLHFLVMEYVDGSSLQDIVARKGAMDITRACHYVRQAARGLEHIHEVGLVHRDIKPANLLLDRGGTVKILDLGLASFHQGPQEPVPGKKDKTMVGTDDYLAPEQIVCSEEADVRADVYSLGGTFYFLLTGYSPYEEANLPYQKLLRHLAQRPKPVRDLRPEVPGELQEIILKMMAKNPWERYQTPQAVVEALAPFAPVPIPPPPPEEMPRLSPAVYRTRLMEKGSRVVGVAAPGNSAVQHQATQGSSLNSSMFSDISKSQAHAPTAASGGTRPAPDNGPQAALPADLAKAEQQAKSPKS